MEGFPLPYPQIGGMPLVQLNGQLAFMPAGLAGGMAQAALMTPVLAIVTPFS